jgi:hypothetical protein
VPNRCEYSHARRWRTRLLQFPWGLPTSQVGGALGLAILATVANSRTQGLLSGGVHPSVPLTKGFDRAFLVGAGFAIVGAILAAVLISSRDSREQAEVARCSELDVIPA